MTPTIWTSPRLDAPAGRRVPITWSGFADRVGAAREAPTKEGLARWSPAEFRHDYRCRANIVRVWAAVLDVDDGSALDCIFDALDGLMVIAHSTFRSTPDVPRWRVVVPLDRCVDADAYDRVWRWLAAAFEREGAGPDFAGRDACHAWAVPARPPGGHYVTRVELGGSMASVADALVAIPAPEPMVVPRREPRGDSYDQRAERARRYVATMDPAISGSGGHRATFRAALALVRGFALEPDDALAIMVEEFNPRCSPAWTVADLKHKVRSALQRARVPFGAIAERGKR